VEGLRLGFLLLVGFEVSGSIKYIRSRFLLPTTLCTLDIHIQSLLSILTFNIP
jgi:hypothetical protein